MKYSSELKVIDTQEKAYLLGFLYGDGCICTYAEKTGRIRFLTKISISIDDKEIIEQLYKFFPFFNLGGFDYSKYNKKCVKQISITKSSKELFNDLLLNGVYPRKSYENANKLRIPNIDKSLISHFIRGFFDADGSVYIPTRRKNLLSIEFSSVSLKFLTDINNYLINLNINCWKIKSKVPSSKGRQVCHNLIFNKTSEILKLINFMYKDSTINLKRKADKCLNYKPVDIFLNRNMICSACNSNKIIKDGKRISSIRYRCKNCGRRFSIKRNKF